MISFRPSMIWSRISGGTGLRRLPVHSTESVRISLTFTQDLLGRFRMAISKVNGKPERCGWVVRAIAMTVPDR